MPKDELQVSRKLKTPSKLAWWLSVTGSAVMAILPFHAFLTVWTSSGLGHYTAIRLWKEVVLVFLVAGCIYILLTDLKLRRRFIKWHLLWLILLYIVLSLGLGFLAYSQDKVTSKSLGYGLIVNLRFLVFFLVCYIIATESPLLKKIWSKIVLISAAAVIVLGLLQRFVLPYDFLKHFGYNQNTIFPYETINYNIRYTRVMSTLRGANPLGAYLILVISAASALAVRLKKYRWPLGLLATSGTAVLVLTYSRAAWLGLAVSLIILGGLILKKNLFKSWLFIGLIGVVVVGASSFAVLRHNPTFENVFFHTQTHSTVKQTSNAGHSQALRNGLHDLAHQPFGQGVGTAGPASVYNLGKTRLAENYYIQIGQETGWPGLLLFLAICLMIVWALWQKRAQTLPAVLLASFAGLVVVNLLSHGWTDDTIAYLWWGLAGIALAPSKL